MALQKSGVNVPIAYEFEPQPREWVIASAEVLGWTEILKLQDPSNPFLPIALNTSKASNTKTSEIGAFDTASVVTVMVTLPSNGFSIGALFSEDMAPKPDRMFFEIGIDHIPGGRPLGCNRVSTPNLGLPYFRVLASRTLSPSSSPKAALRNAWKMTDEFLALQGGDLPSLESFLNRWGSWGMGIRAYDTAACSIMSDKGIVLVPDQIWALHKTYRDARTGPAKSWFTRDKPLFEASSLFGGRSSIRATYPFFVVRQHQCQHAIEATITIDKLRKTQYRFCKHKKCNAIYEVTSKHARGFCSAKCGTAVRVTEFRKRNRKKGSENAKG